MTLREILDRLRILEPELAALGAMNLAVFGSAARGEMRDDSDIDILAEIPNPDFLVYVTIKNLLEERLGRSIDLIEYEAIRPRWKKSILDEAVRVTT